MRMVTDEGIALIEFFEGFRSKPYKDSVGIPTIGIGTTYYPNGKKVTMYDDPIDHDTAVFYLTHELEEKCTVVNSFLLKNNIILSDRQYDSLMSFAYNVGIAPIVCGGRSMNQALKLKMPAIIGDAFLLYCKGTILGIKRTIPGLLTRRRRERDLFLNIKTA